jgi:hypothetical protein
VEMRKKVVAALGIMLVAASVVAAQDEWKFELTPYLWAAGPKGDVEAGGRTVEIDMGIDDYIDAVDIGAGLMTVARKDRLVVWGQYDFVAMDTSKVNEGPLGGSLEADMFYGTLAVGHQFDGPFENSTIDVMGGVRYFWSEYDLKLGRTRSSRGSQDILDAIIVLRPSIRLGKKWRLDSTLSIGSGGSDMVWEVQPTLHYQVRENMDLVLGYRRLHYDVDGERGMNLDAAFQGILLAVAFRL